ncbi:MAG: hypothetical protein ACE5FH_04960 [Candidatus Zixiibacteriota bacterium]
MIYKAKYGSDVIRFSKNRGRSTVEATSVAEAVTKIHQLFGHMREVSVRERSEGTYDVRFKVARDYRLKLLPAVERSLRLIRDRQTFDQARHIDQYIFLTVANERTIPDWLIQDNIEKELNSLRLAAVSAREMSNVAEFRDWDMVIYNYLESCNPAPYKSRVVREMKKQKILT